MDQKRKNSKDQKGKGNQAGSLDDAGQPQEPEAETGSLELGASDASQSRVGQFLKPVEPRFCGISKYKESCYVKVNLETRAAETAFILDIANVRPEPLRHSNGVTSQHLESAHSRLRRSPIGVHR